VLRGHERHPHVSRGHRVEEATHRVDVGEDVREPHVVCGENSFTVVLDLECEIAGGDDIPEPAAPPARLGGQPSGLLA
jgi:hypothetical protein